MVSHAKSARNFPDVVKAEFNEKSNTDRYKAHLADVTKWRNGTPTVVNNICKKLFNHAQ